MSLILVILHVIVCIALIMIVLLQTGKGADMGAAFGGGASQTLFGSTGASTFLSKATTGVAIIFMLTSLGLAFIVSRSNDSSIMKDGAPIESIVETEGSEDEKAGSSESGEPAAESRTEGDESETPAVNPTQTEKDSSE